MEDLVRLLPEGSSVIAVIVIVVLFLRHKREESKDLKEAIQIINQRLTDISEMDDKRLHDFIINYQNKVVELASKLGDSQTRTDQQFQLYFNEYMKLSRDVVSAIETMRASTNKAIDALARKKGPSDEPK